MRGWIYLVAAVTLALVILLALGFGAELLTALRLGAGYAFIYFITAIKAVTLLLWLWWPWLLVAGAGIAAWRLAWSRRPFAESGSPPQPAGFNRADIGLSPAVNSQRASDDTSSRRAELGCFAAAVLALLLVIGIGAIADNVRYMSCSTADQTACPSKVQYEDIHFPGQETDGITDPYSMDFGDPLWPEWLVDATAPDYTSIKNADWAVVYKTWWDGEWWAACRRSTDGSIRCGLIEGTRVPPRLADRTSLIPVPSP